MKRLRQRRIFAALHRYCGLCLLVLVWLLSLTGCILSFGPEIDRLLNPELLQVNRPGIDAVARPYDEQLAAAIESMGTRGNGHWQAVSVTPPADPEASSSFLFRQPDPAHPGKYLWRQVLVDPYTAKALGQRDRSVGELSRSGALSLLVEVHGRLLLGENGRWITGVAAILWTLTTLLGLFLWWPGRRKLKLALGIKRQAGTARLTFDLHRALGFYSAPALLAIAFTGIYMALPGEVRPLVEVVAPLDVVVSPRVEALPTQPRIGIDAAVDIAKATFSEGELRRIGLPRSASDAYAIGFLLPGEVRRPSSGRSVVWIDPYRGQLLQSYDARQAGAGDSFLNWMTPLHTGTAFGFTGRLLVAGSGLLACVLSLAGFLVWHRRSNRLRLRRLAS